MTQKTISYNSNGRLTMEHATVTIAVYIDNDGTYLRSDYFGTMQSVLDWLKEVIGEADVHWGVHRVSARDYNIRSIFRIWFKNQRAQTLFKIAWSHLVIDPDSVEEEYE